MQFKGKYNSKIGWSYQKIEVNNKRMRNKDRVLDSMLQRRVVADPERLQYMIMETAGLWEMEHEGCKKGKKLNTY